MLARVKAAGINPGEAAIRSGALHSRWPATFPSGEGSDLAGIVEEVGSGVTSVRIGDEVLGFTDNRASRAELVVVNAANVIPRPAGVSWEQAGALFVAGATAWATVRAVAPTAQDTVVVSGAANHAWLIDKGVRPDRIDTIANFAAVEKYGVKGDGNAVGGNAAVLAELADLIATGRLDLPIARTYPLTRVRDAFADLERRHTRGKIVLVP